MWLFTKVGFFSVVQTDVDDLPKGVGELGDVLSVRARVEGDLDAFRSAYAPDLTPTIMLPGRDYPYRGFITKDNLSKAMVRMTLDLDYGNFKSMVAKVQGYDRAHLYSEVWGVMNGAERKLGKKAKR